MRKPAKDVDLAKLDRLGQDTRDEYPDIKPIVATEGAFQFSSEGETRTSAQHSQVGYRSIRKDGKQVCQRQLTGFTLSRLPPYDRWEPFRDEARIHWDAYRDLTKPKKVARAAVRYVNRIEIPSPSVDLKKYFRTSPEISPELPQALAGFFMQVRIPQTDIDALAVINQTYAEEPSPKGVSVILDIDLFRVIREEVSEADLWDYFEKLHTRKNRIFEACITDDTRALFD